MTVFHVQVDFQVGEYDGLYILEEGKFLYQKAQKKFLALAENQTHDPRCSSLDILSY